MSDPLLKMSVEQFMADYWQQKPLLIRQAWPDPPNPLDANEIGGLAMESDITSRLVRGPNEKQQWTLDWGPINEETLTTLPESNWTLLIQDLDKLIPEVEQMLRKFNFIPDWRIDDVMVSLAADGGSVGPHWDHYDVFLLQAQGIRRWQVDENSQPDLSYQPDQPLKLLQHFNPTRSWYLHPGDMLYLPPGMPHFGIAQRTCITYSIGMRAPAYTELMDDFFEDTAKRLSEHQRFSDPGRMPAVHPAEIDSDSQAQVVNTLQQLTQDPEQIRRWFGRFISAYRSDLTEPIVRPVEDATRQLNDAIQSGQGLERDPWLRCNFAEIGSQCFLYVAGLEFPTERHWAECLTADRVIDITTLQEIIRDPQAKQLLLELMRRDFWQPIYD